MALQHLRSSTANKRPTPAGMSDGQLALNTNDASPGLFFKDSNGALVKVGPVHVGTTAPNATPGSGGSSGNAIGEQWLDTTGGTYVFKVWDGSAWRSESGTFVDVNGDVMTGALGIIAGTAGSPGLYFSGDTNTGLYSPGADQVAISTGGSGRLFVDSSGNVGVGTSPASKLHVNAATGSVFTQISSGANDLYLGYDAIAGLQSLQSDTGIYFSTGASFTERLRITSAGLVGVGTSSPQQALSVTGGVQRNAVTLGTSASPSEETGYIYKFEGASGTQAGLYFINTHNSNNATWLSFKTTTSANVTNTALTIDSSGRVGVGTTTVDKLLTLNDTSGATLALKTGANTSSSIHGLEFYDRQGTASFPSSPGQLTSYVRSERNGGNAEFSLTFGTTNSTSANASERLRIDSSGRVGIGTSSPSVLLDVYGTGSVLGKFVRNNTGGASGGVTIGNNDRTYTLFGDGSIFSLYDNTAAATRLAVDTSGRVGIGTSAPGQKFVVNGTSGSNAIQIENSDDANRGGRLLATGSAASGVFQINSTSGGYGITLGIDGNEAVRVDTSRRLLVGTSSARSNFLSIASPVFQIEGVTDPNIFASIVSCQNDATAGSRLILGHQKSGTVGGNAVLASGDNIGRVDFRGGDGANFVAAAEISAFVDGTPGANDMPGRLVFSTTADGASSPTERMRIDNAGDIGLSTTSDGLFGKDPRLAVSKTVASGKCVIQINAAGSFGNTDRNALECIDDGGEKLFIRQNGNVVNLNNSYGAISDVKLKENIVDASSQWSDIKTLQVRNYNLKSDQTHRQIGVVAQEVELISPGLVIDSPDYDEDGNALGTVTKSVNYSVLYMKAVKALQEAMERIETLEAKVAALETT